MLLTKDKKELINAQTKRKIKSDIKHQKTTTIFPTKQKKHTHRIILFEKIPQRLLVEICLVRAGLNNFLCVHGKLVVALRVCAWKKGVRHTT